MPPKIEVIDETLLPAVEDKRRDPFAAPRKNTTVRVDPKDVTNSDYRGGPIKGLNKPQIASNAPLDKLFAQLETQIMLKSLEDISLDELESRMQRQDRVAMVAHLLESLLQIQRLAKESKAKRSVDGAAHHKSLISISLHDIRTFSRLVNLIIIFGVYPALDKFHIGIPLAKRRLNDYSRGKTPIKVGEVATAEEAESLLTLLFDRFMELFDTTADLDDVRELLLRGTGYSDFLTISLALVTVPTIAQCTRQRVSKALPQVMSMPDTFELFQTFTLLLTSPSPAFFKEYVLQQLQTLHYNAPRGDGLITLIEFVLGLRDNEEVKVEKFDQVANVVLAKPKLMDTKAYFTSIGDQMYQLLININKPVVSSCVCYVLEKLWVRNQRVVQDFMLQTISTRFNPSTSDSKTTNDVLVTESQLNNNLNVLISLTKNNPSASLLSATFRPILSYVWGYSIYLDQAQKSNVAVRNTLVSYFTILKAQSAELAYEHLDVLAKNLLCDGGDGWTFSTGPNGMVEISTRAQQTINATNESKVGKFLELLDVATKAFVELLDELEDVFVQREFVVVFKRWLTEGQSSGLVVSDNPFFKLIDLRLLESLGDKFRDSLGKSPLEILEIAHSFLVVAVKRVSLHGLQSGKASSEDADSDDETDDEDNSEFVSATLPVLLELISAILSESDPSELNDECLVMLEKVKSRLQEVSRYPSLVSPGAQSLSERISHLLEGDRGAPKSAHHRQAETLKLAITSLNDPLVPIRAHGLHLLRQLIENKDTDVISLDFVIELHLNQLKDPEPFIYLNVIKGLQQLIHWNEREVVPTYTKIYSAPDSTFSLDEKLRIGEVLLRYIQDSNELFTGDMAEVVVQGAISLVRREAGAPLVDNTLRNSAMSILGVCCMTNPLGMVHSLDDALDCALGILKLERSVDEAVMRRSAVVLIHDLIVGTSKSEILPFPSAYRLQVKSALSYAFDTDNDLLVRDQAKSVLDTIERLSRLSVEGEGQSMI
ncbi:RNA polymerase II assembly factor Rtp1 C-terminal domain-containing protein [[Candida] zeylanoides]